MTAQLALVQKDSEPSWRQLPRWRGFNVMNMYMKGAEFPFCELDFRLIADWGFNFVRIPMDYRSWTSQENWRDIGWTSQENWSDIREATLRELDRAIEWGVKWNVHVNLNLHRTPGYCVNPPEEPREIWSDSEAQSATALHWATLAKRYHGIANRHLSFNPINEPGFISHKAYERVLRPILAAVRSADSKRLVIVDGLGFGTLPVPELLHLEVAQSTRGYSPGALAFFASPWHPGSDCLPEPTWPLRQHVGRYLYGSAHPDIQSALTIDGDFPPGTEIGIEVHQVSQKCVLEVRQDGQLVGRERMISGPGSGPWKRAILNEEHNIYQNIFDREVRWKLSASASTLTFEIAEGDWLSFNSINITVPGRARVVVSPASLDWGITQGRLRIDEASNITHVDGSDLFGRQHIEERDIAPWRNLQRAGVGVMIGEWGAYNKAPHAHVLAWAEDNLSLWRREGWGWALWNLDGPFGIIDSGRHDAKYELVAGRKVDIKFLKLLQRY